MNTPILIFLLLASLAFSGEPTLVDGKAVAFRLGVKTLWFGTDSTIALSKMSDDEFEVPFDIFNISSESADIYVSQVWPEEANFSLSVSFAWAFVCDLVRSAPALAKGNLVSGPCGAGWQVDTVSSAITIKSAGVWTPLRSSAVKDSVAEKLNRMSSYEAQIQFSLSGADSIEISVANWITDQSVFSAPSTNALPERLSLRGNTGSDLHVESSEIPLGIVAKPSQSKHMSPVQAQFTGHSMHLHWNSGSLDVLGRVSPQP